MASNAPAAEVKIAKTPEPPTFQTVEQERLHRKQRLASAFRLFAKFGFSEGVAGHITARDPERLDHFWVNPFGMHYSQIRVSDLILVNEDGDVVEGDRPVNEAAFAIHSRLHMARPDVVAAAHAHSLYGKTWASLGRLLDPLTQGRLRLLRRSQSFRRLHRRGLRHVGGRSYRCCPGPPQSDYPAESRYSYRGPHRRRGGHGFTSPWTAVASRN